MVLLLKCSFGVLYDWCVRVWEGFCMIGVYVCGRDLVRGSE